jgi:hypothetical protein
LPATLTRSPVRENDALDRAGAGAAHRACIGAAVAVGRGAAVDDPAARAGAVKTAQAKRLVAGDRLAARELDVGGQARRRAVEPAASISAVNDGAAVATTIAVIATTIAKLEQRQPC